jgi:hypothetical protein
MRRRQDRSAGYETGDAAAGQQAGAPQQGMPQQGAPQQQGTQQGMQQGTQQGMPQQGTQQGMQQQQGAQPGMQPAGQQGGTATGYAQPAGREQGQPDYGREEYGRGRGGYPERGRGTAQAGGTLLAGTLLMLGGLWSFLEGIVAILRQGFFNTATAHAGTYLYQFDVHGWGWLHLALGIALFAAGACVLLGQTWARILGIVLAVFSGLANFMFLPYYPVWSIVLIAIDIFIIWALATSGRRAAI